MRIFFIFLDLGWFVVSCADGGERRFAPLLRIGGPVDDVDCWEGYSWCFGGVVISLICVFWILFAGGSNPHQRSEAPLSSHPSP